MSARAIRVERDMGLQMLTTSSAQAKKFKAPSAKQSIRIRSTIDLSYPISSAHRKSVLVAPIDSLPLKSKDARQRIKLLAGPRWTPGYPGKHESAAHQGGSNDGWIKISEERFPDARTNRWNVGQTLEKLVEAANVSRRCIAGLQIRLLMLCRTLNRPCRRLLLSTRDIWQHVS